MSETSKQTAAAVETAEPAVQTQQTDVLDQLMKPEVQESLTVLVESLPKLTEMVKLMTKAYDVAQSLATDQVLISDMAGGLKEFAAPITEKAKEYAQAAIEAHDRTQTESATIGLFGLLRMLKDPNVQRVLRYSQAFLDVLGEKQKQHQ